MNSIASFHSAMRCLYVKRLQRSVNNDAPIIYGEERLPMSRAKITGAWD